MSKLSDVGIWLAVGRDMDGEPLRLVLLSNYSDSGLTVTVRLRHNGNIVGRAHGGGYDKTSQALGLALETLFGIPYANDRIAEHAAAHGIRFMSVTDAVWALDEIAR